MHLGNVLWMQGSGVGEPIPFFVQKMLLKIGWKKKRPWISLSLSVFFEIKKTFYIGTTQPPPNPWYLCHLVASLGLCILCMEQPQHMIPNARPTKFKFFTKKKQKTVFVPTWIYKGKKGGFCNQRHFLIFPIGKSKALFRTYTYIYIIYIIYV